MKSANEINKELVDITAELRAGTIDVQKAMAISNMYGRVCSIATLQLRYAAQTKQTIEVDFIQKDVKKHDPA